MDEAEVQERLDDADKALTNLDEFGEAFDSAISAARASINSARAILLERNGK